MENTYNEGMRDGEHRVWDPQGQLISSTIFAYDEEVRPITLLVTEVAKPEPEECNVCYT